MSEQVPDYVVISQSHLNRWMDDLQRAIPGWEITVKDNLTGVVLPVFLSDDQYTVENARLLIESALHPVREVHFLNR